MMKLARLTWVFAIAFTIVSCTHSISVPLDQEVDNLLSSYADKYKFNGSIFIARHGEVILNKGYGWKNWESKVMNDSNTIFQIGSISKQFTAALILKLQEQGKLSVDDKLEKYFPDLPGADKITIDQLVTHRSGLSNYTDDAEYMRRESDKPHSREKMIGLFKDRPLEFEPGTQHLYSNSGYMLLGYIIEIATGKSYFQVMREEIFEPLGMNHTGFDFVALNDPDKATGYAHLEKDRQQLATIIDSTVSHAAGAMYSTTADLYKWDRALYTEKVLSKKSLEFAYTPQLNDYAYGWRINTENGRKSMFHSGGIYGFASWMYRRPDDETCVIIFDNHDVAIKKLWVELKNIIDKNKQTEKP